MTITTTQRHTPAESVNERTSGRRIDAAQQFVSYRITETGNTDAAGKFTITHTPIGSLARQFDTLSRINREPDLVALTANDQTLYTGGFDQDNKTIELYTDVAKTTPAANLIGAKVSYWYYAPVKGILNTDGTFTPEVASGNINTALADVLAALQGTLAVQLTGNILTDLGQTSDVAIAAGEVGSLSAKIRRLTIDLDTLLARIGDIGDSPAANTVLARLKSIKEGSSALLKAKDSSGQEHELLGILNPDDKLILGTHEMAPWFVVRDVDGALTDLLTTNEGAMLVNPQRPTKIDIYNVTCTNSNTEYSQMLPVNCKRLALSIRDGVVANNFRISFTSGKVATPTAPYLKFSQDKEYRVESLDLYADTVYFASSLAGAVVQIEAWS